ncbi:hypothetical protein SSS_06368 [Sarcoptes scabiei]|uniref:Uncharacterized protein n=1 Tax=Sarcoptes scabiei TaxID=52283 RepID=A0A834VDT9_SARSC|nr:hypothetical protein SSS_06368 [Sarcoptes scabiei]
MDPELKARIDKLCAIDLEEKSNDLLQDSPLWIRVQKNFEKMLQELPQIDSMIQLNDLNSTIDLTADMSVSFLNESRRSLNIAKTNKYLSVDTRNENFNSLLENDYQEKKFDAKILARFFEIHRQNYYDKFSQKLQRKINRLDYYLDSLDSMKIEKNSLP